MQKKCRTMFFVDGFNVYYAIRESNLNKYKWLDYWRLANRFLEPGDQLEGVLYFTAYTRSNTPAGKRKRTRHRHFVIANQNRGVQIVLGRHKRRSRKCTKCGEYYSTYEEKRTDVNIAVHLLKKAIDERYDKAVIVSGDSDLIPAISAAKDTFREKKFSLVIPIGRHAEELRGIVGVNSSRRMKERHLRESQLPDELTIDNTTVLCRPKEWY